MLLAYRYVIFIGNWLIVNIVIVKKKKKSFSITNLAIHTTQTHTNTQTNILLIYSIVMNCFV